MEAFNSNGTSGSKSYRKVSCLKTENRGVQYLAFFISFETVAPASHEKHRKLEYVIQQVNDLYIWILLFLFSIYFPKNFSNLFLYWPSLEKIKPSSWCQYMILRHDWI